MTKTWYERGWETVERFISGEERLIIDVLPFAMNTHNEGKSFTESSINWRPLNGLRQAYEMQSYGLVTIGLVGEHVQHQNDRALQTQYWTTYEVSPTPLYRQIVAAYHHWRSGWFELSSYKYMFHAHYVVSTHRSHFLYDSGKGVEKYTTWQMNVVREAVSEWKAARPGVSDE